MPGRSTSGSSLAYYTTRGFYVLFSVGNRDERDFNEVRRYAPEGGR